MPRMPIEELEVMAKIEKIQDLDLRGRVVEVRNQLTTLLRYYVYKHFTGLLLGSLFVMPILGTNKAPSFSEIVNSVIIFMAAFLVGKLAAQRILEKREQGAAKALRRKLYTDSRYRDALHFIRDNDPGFHKVAEKLLKEVS